MYAIAIPVLLVPLVILKFAIRTPGREVGLAMNSMGWPAQIPASCKLGMTAIRWLTFAQFALAILFRYVRAGGG